jgi:protein-tyrosine phosphatase
MTLGILVGVPSEPVPFHAGTMRRGATRDWWPTRAERSETVPSVYWVKGVAGIRLGFMPRPRGTAFLEEEILSWRRAGVDVAVSLLQADEVSAFGLTEEGPLCGESGIEFHSFPIEDHGVPSSVEEVRQLAGGLALKLAEGKGVAIHCYAGIGRSALVTACVLATCGVAPKEVIPILCRSRGLIVPETDEQVAWFEKYVEETGISSREAQPEGDSGDRVSARQCSCTSPRKVMWMWPREAS